MGNRKMLANSERNNYNLLINSKIHVLLKGKSESCVNPLKKGCYIQNFRYNWDSIEQSFMDKFERDDYSTFTYENCLQYTELLRPIWMESLFELKNCNNFEHILMSNLQWTGNAEIIKKFFYSSKSPTYIVENCLLLTSIIENALGNVFYTLTQNSPPHLLRDLLNCSELKRFFGEFPIFFLRILMGTPNSINLRNLLWHGFPSPNDIDEYFLAVLLIILISFSCIIEERNFTIIFRDKIVISINVLQKQIPLKTTTFDNELVSQKVLNESKYIFTNHKIFWEKLYQYFLEGDFERFVILVLPQIELILRIIYGKCNQIDITAKLDEYYIIIDTIFEESVINSIENNMIFTYLNSGTLKLLYDLFISPNGPRIRDKVSHGEIDFCSLDKNICSVLLFVSLNIMQDTSNMSEFNVSHYESKFHLNTIVFEEFKDLKNVLTELRNISIPNELEDVIEWDYTKNCDNDEVKTISENLQTIEIFFRPKQESELVTILIKICKHFKLSCKNLCHSFEVRFTLYFNKQLRSKRRKTLENMLKSLPFLYNNFELMIYTMKRIFYTLQFKGRENSGDFFTNTLRFLKQLLKWVENLAKYCCVTSNEWERATKICLNFRESYKKFKINYS